MTRTRPGSIAALLALALVGAVWCMFGPNFAGTNGPGLAPSAAAPSTTNEPGVAGAPPVDEVSSRLAVAPRSTLPANAIMFECHCLGGGFQELPARVEVVVGSLTPIVVAPAEMQVADGVLRVALVSKAFEDRVQGAPVEVRVPGFVPSRTTMPPKPNPVSLTCVPTGALEIELLGSSEAVVADLVQHLEVAVWVGPVGAAKEIAHADGSFLKLPDLDLPMPRTRLRIDDLPRGVTLEVGIAGDGRPITDSVQVRVPQMVQLQVKETGLITVRCDQEVDGVVNCRNGMGRARSARVVRGRSTLLWDEESREGLCCEAWGDGWMAESVAVPAGFAAPVRLAVRPRPTLAIDLDSTSNVEVRLVGDRHLESLGSFASAGRPVCWQRNNQLLVAGVSSGRILLVWSIEERCVCQLLVPEGRTAKLALASRPRGMVHDGVRQYQRFRAMYRGTRDAVCHIGIVVPVAVGREELVLLECLYFFDNGLGDFARSESWWFRDPAPGRYVLVVEAAHKELDRVDLPWQADAAGR